MCVIHEAMNGCKNLKIHKRIASKMCILCVKMNENRVWQVFTNHDFSATKIQCTKLPSHTVNLIQISIIIAPLLKTGVYINIVSAHYLRKYFIESK